MSVHRLLGSFAHAIRAFVDMDEDGEVGPWERQAVFQLDKPVSHIWAGLPCADAPPRCWLLMQRERDGEKVYELLWGREGFEQTKWPVVEVTEVGDAQVLALNAEDWIAGLLYTGGGLGGGSEDDLEDAREEASSEATALADDLLDELDMELPDPEILGERWEDALDLHADAWSDAVEGIEA